MMAFSDFPPPAELPNNMHHSEVLLYMRLYAQAFKLLPHIRFQVSGLKVIRSSGTFFTWTKAYKPAQQVAQHNNPLTHGGFKNDSTPNLQEKYNNKFSLWQINW